jgi:hypothetical protein
MKRNLFAVLATATALAFLTGHHRAAVAQVSEEAAPVDIAIQPKSVAAGMAVTIQITTMPPNEHQAAARVEISKPRGAPTVLAPAPDDAGLIALTFAETASPGDYRVDVTAPDGRGRGSATFQVVSENAYAEELVNTHERIEAAGKRLAERVSEQLEQLPPSPAREEAQRRMEDIDSRYENMRPNLQQVREAINHFGEARSLSPEFSGASQEEWQMMSDWMGQAESQLEELERRGGAAGNDFDVCDGIYYIQESINLIATALTLVQGPYEAVKSIVEDFLIDTVIAETVPEGPNEAAAEFAIGQGVSFGQLAREGLDSVLTGVFDLVTDTASFMADTAFDTYCEQFRGPISLDSEIEMKQGARPWWRYGVQLRGLITLRYERGTPAGEPIRLTGQLEGNATRYTFWENIFVVEPQPRNSIVLLRHRQVPMAGPNVSSDLLGLGAAARAATPGSFYVPLEGTLQNDRISLQIKEAVVDFSDLVKNRLVMVVIAPGLPMPVVKTFSFPIQKAHWHLARGMKSAEPFEVTVGSQSSSFDRTDNYEFETSDGSARATIRMRTQAENPPAD